jgi:NADPH:quinone reductase-like Zn-dependent oxidoreductase
LIQFGTAGVSRPHLLAKRQGADPPPAGASDLLGLEVAGEVALFHGGSSGIGTTAIQLAHAFGARVFTTVGSAEKCKACHVLGAVRAINYRSLGFRPGHGRRRRVVLDVIGGPYFQRNLPVLNVEGRLVRIDSSKAQGRT